MRDGDDRDLPIWVYTGRCRCGQKRQFWSATMAYKNPLGKMAYRIPSHSSAVR